MDGRTRRCSVALRFQDRDDEIDRAAKEERATPVLILFFVLFAAIHGVVWWFSGGSLASYAKDLAWMLGFGLAYWMLAPFYYEFRIRSKEILGTVTKIEEAVSAVKEDQKELLERLSAIEDKLRSLRR